MESFFVRYRNLLVLLALLLVQIIGLAVQVRRTDAGHRTLDTADSSGVRLIRLWANAVVSPAERVVEYSKTGVGGIWQNYVDLRHVRQQNRDLQDTVDRLRLEQAALARRRAPGSAPAGDARLSAEIPLQDAARPDHRLQRFGPVAGLLYRQGQKPTAWSATWR